jgi:hypothetical protein
MPTLQTQTTTGAPVTVVYPAEKLSGHRTTVQFRIGKKTVLPAYTDANLPYLVQFQIGQRTVMFMLSDILQTSYWQRIRNAYNVFGQLDVDADVKMGTDATEQVAQWLREQSSIRGVTLDARA